MSMRSRGKFDGYSLIGGQRVFIREAGGRWSAMVQVTPEQGTKLEKIYDENFAEMIIDSTKIALGIGLEKRAAMEKEIEEAKNGA